MAVTVSGTSITFNDGTVQSTAAGSTELGGIGTYAFLSYATNSPLDPGATVAGSNLRYRAAASYAVVQGIYINAAASPTPISGTWKLMGKIEFSWEYYGVQYNHQQASSVWLRIA